MTVSGYTVRQKLLIEFCLREIPFMSKTINEEIDSFSNYARRHSGEVESLDVLYRRWREQTEREDVIAAAGRTWPKGQRCVRRTST